MIVILYAELDVILIMFLKVLAVPCNGVRFFSRSQADFGNLPNSKSVFAKIVLVLSMHSRPLEWGDGQ